MGDQEKEDLQAAEVEFKQRLLELGLLTRITPPVPQGSRPRHRKPVPVAGNAVSETVIQERR
jgi:hypothetical protein